MYRSVSHLPFCLTSSLARVILTTLVNISLIDRIRGQSTFRSLQLYNQVHKRVQPLQSPVMAAC